jgi:hypothetical protein
MAGLEDPVVGKAEELKGKDHIADTADRHNR